MVAPPRTPLRADRLRALNVPQPVTVALDADGLPAAVSDTTVESVREIWRIDDEWWRQPVSRRYHEVVLEGGRRVVLFEDLVTGDWFVQKP